tara:strand:- start:1340 stop:2245 length:906 start_codon:yes stop_codon:yes gene_type:complete
METRASYITVGAFVLALLTGLLLFVLWMSRVDFRAHLPTYHIYFSGSVAGLRENDSVRFHGIPIGKVKKISVDPKNVERVIVEATIDHTYLIREDSVAFVEAQGLTGYSYIHIKGGTEESPILKTKPGESYPVIQSEASSIEMLFGSLPNILEKIYELSDRFNRLLSDKNLEDLTGSIKHFSDLTEKLATGSNSLDVFMGQARQTLEAFEGTLKGVTTTLEGPNFAETLKSVTNAARELDRFLEENRRSVQQFTSLGLEDFTRLMGETRQTVSTLNRVLLDLEQSPSNFLNKNTTQGYRVP